MKLADIKPLIGEGYGGMYACDVSWSELESWLGKKGERFDLDPDFQRGHVWSIFQRVRFVEFMLRGGQSCRNILWNCKGWAFGSPNPIVLVDGKQRLESVRQFMRGTSRHSGV